MTIKSAIYKVLSTVAPAYPVVAPQGTKPPWIRYQGISGSDAVSYDGDGGGATSARVQVDVYAADYATADRLSQAARAALYAAAGVTVGDITDNPDSYEADTKIYCVSFDVTIWS